MNKYLKSMAIAVLAVVTLGVFYVHSAVSASQFPQFVIEDQSGQASLAESIEIEGLYRQDQMGGIVEITHAGSKHENERTFLDQLIGNPQPMIGQLIKEHRNFMRGKNGGPKSFYEDEQFLVYADVTYRTSAYTPSDFKFEISILDKTAGDTTAYKLPIPNEADYRYIRIEDVQMIQNQLVIITNNFSKGSEIHTYTMDIATEQWVADETVFAGTHADEQSYSEFSLMNESNLKGSRSTIIVAEQIRKDVEQSDGRRETIDEGHKLIAYNLETKAKKEILVPEELQNAGAAQAFDDSVLYFMYVNQYEVVVTPYQIEDEQPGEVVTVHFPAIEVDVEDGGPNQDQEFPIGVIQDGKLYSLSRNFEKDSAATLFITDLRTGETLYQGRIVEKNSDHEGAPYKLILFGISI